MAHRRERAVGFDHVTVEKILKPLELLVMSALGLNERKVALAISLGNATQCF